MLVKKLADKVNAPGDTPAARIAAVKTASTREPSMAFAWAPP
jgi:hypothetical protein